MTSLSPRSACRVGLTTSHEGSLTPNEKNSNHGLELSRYPAEQSNSPSDGDNKYFEPEHSEIYLSKSQYMDHYEKQFGKMESANSTIDTPKTATEKVIELKQVRQNVISLDSPDDEIPQDKPM